MYFTYFVYFSFVYLTLVVFFVPKRTRCAIIARFYYKIKYGIIARFYCKSKYGIIARFYCKIK